MNEFGNANTLANAVYDTLGAPYVLRSFNRFCPDESLWWLVRSKYWPAYKHGKLFFTPCPEQLPDHQNGIFCRFHIEKGLSRGVASFYHEELIEGDDWAWERFTASISEKFPLLPPPQYVLVCVSHIPIETARYDESPESFFAQKDSFAASRAYFAIDAHQHLDLLAMDVNQNSVDLAQYFETKIRVTASLSSLLANLRTFPQSDWSWVDFYIGTVVTKGSIGNLWNNYLKPWSEWLRIRPTGPRGRS